MVVALLLLMLTAGLASAQTYTPTLLGANFVPWAVNQFGAVCGQLDGFPGWWWPGWASPQYLPGATAATPGTCHTITDNGDVAGEVYLTDAAGIHSRGFLCRAPCQQGIQLAKMPQWSWKTDPNGQSGIDTMGNDRSWSGWAIGVNNAKWLWAPRPMGNFYVYPKELVNTGTAGPVPVSLMTRDGSELVASYDLGIGELGYNLSYTPSTNTLIELPRGNIHGVSHLHWKIGDGGNPDAIQAQVWLPSGETRLLTPGCPETSAPIARERPRRLRDRVPQGVSLPPKVERLLVSLDAETPIVSSGLGINQAVSAVGFTQCPSSSWSWQWDHWTGVFYDLDTLSGASVLVPVDKGFGGHVIALCVVGSGVEGCLLTPVVTAASQ